MIQVGEWSEPSNRATEVQMDYADAKPELVAEGGQTLCISFALLVSLDSPSICSNERRWSSCSEYCRMPYK